MFASLAILCFSFGALHLRDSWSCALDTPSFALVVLCRASRAGCDHYAREHRLVRERLRRANDDLLRHQARRAEARVPRRGHAGGLRLAAHAHIDGCQDQDGHVPGRRSRPRPHAPRLCSRCARQGVHARLNPGLWGSVLALDWRGQAASGDQGTGDQS
eukprot:4474450-Pleurochrysis_carterae.AAC.2